MNGEGGASGGVPIGRAERATELASLGPQIAAAYARAAARNALSLGSGGTSWSDGHRAAAGLILSTFGRLRGAPAKLGQLLALRPGALPEQYIDAMQVLTDRVPPMSFAFVRRQLLHHLGAEPGALFARFEPEPFAAASLGQVHAATMEDGTEVAVKVQYPGIAEATEADLENAELLLPAIGTALGRVDLGPVLGEVRARLREEVDYRIEASRGRWFRDVMPQADFFIPATFPTRTARGVLTAELVRGDTLETFTARGPSQDERMRFTRLLFRFTWGNIFRHGRLHADPNPANYLFCRDGRLGAIDFGCVKVYAPSFVENLRALICAGLEGDATRIRAALDASGITGEGTTSEDLDLLLELIGLWSLPGRTDHFDFGDARYFSSLLETQRAALSPRSVRLPPEWVFYGRHVAGLNYLLFKLGAAGNYRALFEEQLAR